MKFEVPELPYAPSDLEPFISRNTVEIHYGKHHSGYMDKLRKAIEGKPEAESELPDLIRESEGDLFNNAAQVWNHSFYWKSMKPGGGGEASPAVTKLLSATFGSVAQFKREFGQAANGEFGSGWAWLTIRPDGRLQIVSSSDADNPLRKGATPILTLDVWEHAYYLDYQNERDRYVTGFLDHLLNWEFVEQNLDKAGAL